MLLSIFALLLIGGVTFYHSIFGLFSGIINSFCTVISVCIAYGFFEPTHHMLNGIGLHPAYALPVAFVMLFVVSLIVLRTLADNYIRGNVRVPMYMDWGGGAVCGFVNGMCITGVLTTGFMLLPFGPGLPFTPAERTESKEKGRVQFEKHSIWLRPDAFTAGLFSLISSGSASGETSFASVYPNMPEWVWWSGNTIQQESNPTVYNDKDGNGVEKGIEVVKWWEQKTPVEAQYRTNFVNRQDDNPKYEQQTFTPEPGAKLIGANLVLKRASADREKFNAVHNFRPTMIRLVGETDTGPYHATPVIVAGADKPIKGRPRIVDPDSNFSLTAEGDVAVDVYFQVPASFEPDFIEYRRFARTEMSASSQSKAPAPRTLALRTADEEQLYQNLVGQGFLSGATQGDTGDSDRLPFGMSIDAVRSRGQDVEMAEGRFVSGRVSGARSVLQTKQNETGVDFIKRPEGKRIIQVRLRPREAYTLAGEVFNFAAQLDQYFLVDDKNNRYPLSGYYGLARRGNEDFLEFQFDPEGTASRMMLDFKELRTKDMIDGSQDATVGLIFVVPPGTTFTRIENQARKKVDVSLQSSQNQGSGGGGG